tara:strand:+ start:6196 stop:7398 length:1203 start_codon:yes stop_codon:yes gene_type:complete
MGKLTALSAKAASKPGRYQDGNGLALLVKASGARSWMLRIQVDGRRRDFGLGSFNDLSLASAREAADAIRKQYKSGIDPVAAKRAAKAARTTIPTFRAAAKTAHGEQKAAWRNTKHKAQWLSSLETYAFPSIGDLLVDQIDGPMIRDLLLPIWLDKPETARRVRQRVGSVLDWSHSKGFRALEAPMRSVTKGLPRQPKKDRHFASLPYAEVTNLMSHLEESGGAGALALQFLILTAARSGEVRGATWEEIDLEAALWAVPGIRMKAGKEHIVPLSDPALAILEKVKLLGTGRSNSPVFPGNRGKAMSDMTISKALKTAGAVKCTVHGFRSSFRDWAAEMTGTQGDVVEAALAHSISNRIEAAYRRTNYLEKRRVLMNAWAAYLGNMPSNVLAMPTRESNP